MKNTNMFPRPKEITVVDKQGVDVRVRVMPLVWDEIFGLIDEITLVVEQMIKSGLDLSKEFQLTDIKHVMPVIQEIKKILVASIDKDIEWFGKNATGAMVMYLITQIIEINGIEAIMENFTVAKDQITQHLKNKKIK